LRQQVASGAAVLRAGGVAPGTPIILSSPNHPAVAAAYFAIHAAGAVAAIVAPDTPEAELAELAARIGATLVIGEREPGGLEQLAFEELASQPRAALSYDLDPASPADLMFTSGTTGRKKIVELSHAAVASLGRHYSLALCLTPDDVLAVPLPLSHSFGLGTLRATVTVGNALHLERNLVAPKAVIKRLGEVGATVLAMVPAGIELVRQLSRDELGQLKGQLRLIELGSAPISDDTLNWLRTTLPGTRILHHYGATEASRAAFADRSQGGTPVYFGGDGIHLTVDDAGQVHVAGGQIMSGYRLDDGSLDTARLGPHGYATGDLGSLDHDGGLTLIGRQDDIINVGGKKVSPDEVEDALKRHPAVADACARPYPDALLGQVVEAAIVYAAPVSDEELVASISDVLQDYKLPRRFRAVEAIPRTASGKPQRALLDG
jgi:long-chain acyl-CoA synthetase